MASLSTNKQKKHDVRLSKKLSQLLRHDPRGLDVRADGYVLIRCILEFDDFKSYDLSDVVRVVQANDKQRFSLDGKDDSMLIRANQGHTIKMVDQEKLLTRVTNPADIPCCVHGTTFKFWDLIKKSGLNKMSRNHVHMAVGVPEADGVISGMRKSCQVVVYVDVCRAMEEGGLVFYRSSNGVILCEGPIPSQFFSKCIRRKDGVNLFDLKIDLESDGGGGGGGDGDGDGDGDGEAEMTSTTSPAPSFKQ